MKMIVRRIYYEHVQPQAGSSVKTSAQNRAPRTQMTNAPPLQDERPSVMLAESSSIAISMPNLRLESQLEVGAIGSDWDGGAEEERSDDGKDQIVEDVIVGFGTPRHSTRGFPWKTLWTLILLMALVGISLRTWKALSHENPHRPARGVDSPTYAVQSVLDALAYSSDSYHPFIFDTSVSEEEEVSGKSPFAALRKTFIQGFKRIWIEQIMQNVTITVEGK
eukprot:jgi/Bigna1/71820/fgenesh1_pg.17_\